MHISLRLSSFHSVSGLSQVQLYNYACIIFLHTDSVYIIVRTPPPPQHLLPAYTQRAPQNNTRHKNNEPFRTRFHTIFDFFLQLQCSLSHPPYAALYYGSTCIIRHSVYSPTHIRDATGHFSHPLFLISSSFGSQRNNGPFDIILDRLLSHLTFFFFLLSHLNNFLLLASFAFLH